ncbi:porin PorA family protein [Lysobacter korlensis]|uniref:Porin PorA family protein n=1 Tax=Lysobacter korlensis TaxID=553636 RepID=A0ABV6RLB2_9GAMM
MRLQGSAASWHSPRRVVQRHGVQRHVEADTCASSCTSVRTSRHTLPGRYRDQSPSVARPRAFQRERTVLLSTVTPPGITCISGKRGTDVSRIDARPLGIVLLLAAALWLVLGAPLASRLPDDYKAELYFNSLARARETPTGQWERIALVGRRLDTTLLSTENRSIIQSDGYWALPGGELYFENAGVYAVDRETRQNLSGLGDVERRGVFMFPPGLAGGSHVLWDSQLAGPRDVRFERFAEVDGMRVHRFKFRVSALDETSGYGHLPDVPERYRALTNAEGVLHVEPKSGVIVDYSESGRSSFATPEGRLVAPFFIWTAQFTEETQRNQLQKARQARQRLWLLQTLVPLLLAAAGAGLLIFGTLAARRKG